MPPHIAQVDNTASIRSSQNKKKVVTEVDFEVKSSDMKKMKIISWEEIKKHNKYDDCWIVSHDKVYDVTQWAKRHPGGDMILLGGGCDVTVQVESYHPDGIKDSLLKKFCIGVVETSSEDNTYYDWSSDFYPVMRKRVLDALVKAKLPRRGGATMLFKTFLILAAWSISWYYAFVKGSFIGAAVFGFMCSQIGVSVMHDGSHGSYSSMHPYIGKVASYGMDLIGSSSTCWEYQHIMGHHPFTNLGSRTNEYENDPDVFSSYPFVKMHPNDGVKAEWYMKYQHVYAMFLFAMFTMAKVAFGDFGYVKDRKVAHLSMESRLSDPQVMLRFFGFKIFTILAHICVGIYLHGVWTGLGLIAVSHLVCGEFLALMFIVTHISEDCAFLDDQHKPELVTKQKEIVSASGGGTKKAGDTDWAALQCMTSTNWAIDSWFWTHVSGGLNYQIEHHLFPGICHLNYPTIHEAVQTTCEEYGVPYHAHPTLLKGIKAMLNQLYVSGRVGSSEKNKDA